MTDARVPTAALDAPLDTEARIVDGRGAAPGAFNARLGRREGRLVIEPLQLDYLGGTATASLAGGFNRERRPVRLDAAVRALDRFSLLTELGVRPLPMGPLDAPSVAVGSAIGLARQAVVEARALPLEALSAIMPRGAAGVLSTCELER